VKRTEMMILAGHRQETPGFHLRTLLGSSGSKKLEENRDEVFGWSPAGDDWLSLSSRDLLWVQKVGREPDEVFGWSPAGDDWLSLSSRDPLGVGREPR
jgi:hypothetical protein